jgi:hypothetical protein
MRFSGLCLTSVHELSILFQLAVHLGDVMAFGNAINLLLTLLVVVVLRPEAVRS